MKGVTESEYCLQTNRYGEYKKCDVCDMRRSDKSHPAEYLNDHKKNSELTWWQSDTMEYDIQYPNHVNLVIHLGNCKLDLWNDWIFVLKMKKTFLNCLRLSEFYFITSGKFCYLQKDKWEQWMGALPILQCKLSIHIQQNS